MDDEFAISYGMPLVPKTDLPIGKNSCAFNKEVHCPEDQHGDNCKKYGWNPAIEIFRKIKTRERLMEQWSKQS